MRDTISRYCSGYVAAPIIEACRRRGLFDLLCGGEFVQRQHLIEGTEAHPRYLTVALDTLASLGWLERDGADAYRLPPGPDAGWLRVDLTVLYAAGPQQLLHHETHVRQFADALDAVFAQTLPADSLAAVLARGAVMVPLLMALQKLDPSHLRADLARLDERLAACIEHALVSEKLLARTKKGGLTKSGQRLLEVDDFAVVSEYRGFLHRVDDLLFGDTRAAIREAPAPADDPDERACFDELQAGVLALFDQPRFEDQPRAVVDLGSADGCLWEKVYRSVKQGTARGRSLDAHPLRMLSFDRRRRAGGQVAPQRPPLHHQPFITDFYEPAKVVQTLQAHNLDAKDKVLYLHALLDPTFAIDPHHEAELHGPSGAADASTLDGQWRTHLKAWADRIGDSSLLLVEAHGTPELGGNTADDPAAGPEHLETLRRLRDRSSVSAESLLAIAASVGLFNEEAVKRYPKVGPACRFSLHKFKRRDYIIRPACEADLSRLVELEALCWQHTRATPQRIGARMADYREGQLVLEKDGQVLGVIYSQRIADVDALAGCHAGNVHELHDPAGAIVQLLAVNVDPQVQDQQLGDQLLEFMLQKCSLASGVNRVVGVTLCKSYDANGSRSIDEYIRLQGSEQDPVLSFHQDHGAQIVKPLAGYRPEDLANRGHGVLVSYDIQTRTPRRKTTVPACPATEAAVSSTTFTADLEKTSDLVNAEVVELVPELGPAVDPGRPLMELGLNSADLLKLQRRIEARHGKALPAAFFFQHNTIEKVAAFLAANAAADAAAEIPTAPVPVPVVPHSPAGGNAAGGSGMEIAVIGMSCKLPGGIESPDELWQALVDGRSLIGSYPRERGSWPTSIERPGIDRGGFLRDVEAFDSAFFRIAPKEARIIDPQQRMLLELAWACLEDAGVLPATLKGTRTGVFVGASNNDYSRLIQEAQIETEAHHATGNSLAVLANRLSYFFDLCGPSLLIDTACSASLVALHSAMQSLRAGECTAALVGGVNLICHPALSVAYHKAGMLAADGRCKVFDARANGYVRSEGAVAVLLKPLNAALADGDRIHAVIRGSAVNHGGLAAGLTVPNPQKQSELLQAAWQNAGISPRDLSYFEAHGTGTSLGDPIEVQGIEAAFGTMAASDAATPCFVGSVKSNLGHLEAAAGLAGLLKVILSLRHRQVPATIHFEQINPKIRLDDTRLRIAQALRPWDSESARIAGVSSFGSGGANAHAVVQEHVQPVRPATSSQSQLFVLSAVDEERLREHARRVLGWLSHTSRDDEFADAIHTWQAGRTAMAQRLALVVTSCADLQGKLARWLAGEPMADVRTSPAVPKKKPSIEAIESALAARDLERLAALWTSGAAIDWQKLHAADAPAARRRTTVPTYPFARDRYWIEASAATAPNTDAACPLFFEEEWKEQAATEATEATEAAAGVKVVIFADEVFREQITRSDPRGRYSEAIWVTRAADIAQVLDVAAAGSAGPIAVVHAWAQGRAEAGIHALFDLFKILQKSAHPVANVTLVGQYDPARLDTCWDHAWIGFERSLKLSLPQLRISLLYTIDASCAADQLWDAQHSAGAIWYRDEKRHVLSFKPATVARSPEELVLKRHGGYVITGGCGALGHRLATDLARTCAAKLILIGRSPLSPAIQEQLESLRRAGASEVVYQSLDIGDRGATLAWGRSLPFPVCGVIHAAGVFTVEPFDKRSTSEIDKVLRPKTLGTLALDEALAEEPLDFMCHFSSSSAMLGDFGSCDYAIANRFQMAHAQHRAQANRPGRTVLINWPLWKDGGMAPGDAQRTAFYLSSSGQEALETDAGLAIWHDLLAANRLQTLVMVGQPQRIAQSLGRLVETDQSKTSQGMPPRLPEPAEPALARTGSLSDRVLLDIRQLASDCTGTAEEKLRNDTNLADYGFDSIRLADLAQRMTRHFGVTITPIVFFSHATIGQLANHLLEDHAAQLTRVAGAMPAGAMPPSPPQAIDKAAEPVAIVGMSGRFPQARSVDELWTLLAQGRSAITEIPSERWDWREYFVAPRDPRNRITTNQGGFVEGVDEFDPLFFEISPREAEDMDPAERLLMTEAYKALEDAGLAPLALGGSRVGVFVGMEEGQYDAVTGKQGITTSGAAMVSSRLSYFLDLHGPAVATNTACSSGLVALHQAVKSLRHGECDAAIAAAISLSLSPSGYLMMSEAGMLSPEGKCFSFADKADGIGVGEAVVVLVLKPLSAALAAGDPIYGTICASGINFDGKTNGVTAPSGRMQAELFKSVYAESGVDVADIGHIVTHGTGTPLGDPVEITALHTAFKSLGAGRVGQGQCAITSCKSNVGHTLAASGLVSVVSLLKGMQHRQIPPSLNCEVESGYFAWADSPFHVNKTLRGWSAHDKPRMGAVSAFGRSGTNAHVVIAEAPASADATDAIERGGDVVVPLSARTAEQLRQRAEDLLAFIRAGSEIDLQSLACTLQIGRDAMVERLGFVVNSVEQLADGLQATLDGRHDNGGIRGSAKAGKGAPAQIPREWFEQRQLAKLLHAWVTGADVDWRRLHGGSLPRRMRLPTYPFARDRYWASATAEAQHVAPTTKPLHPLLHENTSDMEAQRYTTHFSGEEFFTRDHLVLGQRVLPGVAYLEMARAAVERALPQQSVSSVLELCNTAWLRPFVANPGTSLSIALFDETAGEAASQSLGYEVSSLPADESEMLHCRGRAVLRDRPAMARLDLAALKARVAAEPVDPARLYAAYRKMGLDYGPAFQAIQAVRRGPDELLVQLKLPASAAANVGDYGLPPSLLDGALQSAIAFDADFDSAPGQPPLPFELGSLCVLGSCGSEMLAWVRHTPGGTRSLANAPLDIDLCTPDGEVCVQIRGFCSRSPAAQRESSRITTAVAANDTTSAESGAIGPGLHSFVPVWNVLPPEFSKGKALPASAGVLLLGDDHAQLEFVRKSLPEARALGVPADAGVDTIGRQLQGAAFGQLLWIAPDVMVPADSTQDLQEFITAQNKGVLAVFRIAKALVAGHAAQDLDWTLITRNTQRVKKSDAVAPSHAAIAGLIGSLAKEYPHWKLRLVDIDEPASFPLAECLSLPCDVQGDVHAYRAGEWFRQELAQVAVQLQAAPVYKQNGVYVVIGGAGGLGEVWSRHLIEQFDARIVWIGRRTADASLQAKLDALAEIGTPPVYVAADATDRASLERARDAVLRRCGRIDGVVHSALVLRDQTVGAMDEARFKEALSSKVDISVNMAQAFGALDLDFMLFFSSMMSFLKAPGQSNYAAGCTFKDSFAGSLQGRHRYPVKIMNWGYWGAVGVVSDDFYRKRMEQAGIASIEPNEGLKGLQTLLGSPLTQVVFFKSLDRKILADLRVTATIKHLPAAASTELRDVKDRLAQRGDAAERARLDQGQMPEDVNTLAAQILAASLSSIGLLQGGAPTLHALSGGPHSAPFYERWLVRSIACLQEHGWLAPDATPVRELPSLDALWRGWEVRRAHWDADLGASLALLEACLKALPDILSGRRPATEVMFPDSSMRLVEGVYQKNPTADYYNDVLGSTLRACLEGHVKRGGTAKVRILEIGAGTGGTTARLLPILHEFSGIVAEYCYTDLSRAFLIHAQTHYQPQFPALSTAIFDVSKPVASQSPVPGRYDLVIATNVLHATPDIRESLRNAKALLRGQGVLLLNELSTWTLFNHLTFGLLEGWWLHRDSALRLPGSPVLSPAAWTEVLGEEGFSGIFHPAAAVHACGQQVIAAVSDGVVRQPMPVAQPVVVARQAVAAPLADSSVSVRQAAIAHFQRLVAGSLKMKVDQLDPAEPLEKYGLDSILVVQLANQVRKVIPDITSTLFFEVQTVQGLVDHLLETRADAVKALVAVPVSASSPVQASSAEHAVAQQGLSQAPARLLRRSRQQAHSVVVKDMLSSRAVFDVAIIGCSGRYPKSPDIDAFWKNLASGADCISEIPADRWNWREYFDAEKGKPGKIYTRWGGFIEDIDAFDPLFFKISPREAKGMDPQERLFLQTCYHAIEDAGYTAQTLADNEKVGVFVGVMNSRYNPQPLYYSVANRVSYLFNFQGPSMAVDTACSSSLTAIHLALESLYSGSSECAIAGGVNLIIDPVHYQELSALTMLSAGGQCRSFGAAADGFVDAEGVGAVILKPLANALRDGDHIHAVIKGSAVNAGGKTNGYTVPNPRAQSRVVSSALEHAGVAASDVSCIEAHGTGTALGDPIEIVGLTRAFRESTQANGFCAIGSLKSNIGHCESAAGIAALTKVILQLKHRRLVPSLHCETANPEIDFGQTPFRLQTALEEWRRPQREVHGVVTELPRIAGVSSFGAGGANAHIVVQEHVGTFTGVATQGPVIVPLSARTAEQLTQKARDLLRFLQERTEALAAPDLPAVAFTLQLGREPMEERLAFLVSSIDELQSRLASHLAGEPGVEGICQGQVKRNKDMLAWFAADADLQQTVQKWLIERKLPQLADLWVKGLKVDWNLLYGEHKPARISLPTYPFAKERYWRERPDSALATSKQASPRTLHPLLHENVSTILQHGYRSVFDGTETLLAGWRLADSSGAPARSMIPAAAFLEMARAAVEMASAASRPLGDRVVTQLCKVVWADAVALEGQQPMAVALFVKGGDETGYEIYSPADGGDIVHCQGRALLGCQDAPLRLDLAGLKSRMTRGSVDARSHYAGLAQRGVEYAPAYQGVRAIHRGERELLAEIDARGSAANDLAMGHGELVLNPIVLDSALQAASSLLSPINPPSLPLAVESVRILVPCAQEMIVWARDLDEASESGNHQVDIDLCDGQGNVCVELRGVTYESHPPQSPVMSFGQGQVALREPQVAAITSRAFAKPSGLALA